jgi:hypothetical protein
MKNGDGEPYLADMVAVTAAAIHGVLGIHPTWPRLEVVPCLPADWPRAAADVLYKGRRHRITIHAGRVRIQPLEQAIDRPLLWVMDANMRTTPGGSATMSNVDLGDGSSIALKRVHDDGPEVRFAASGHYQSPVCDWAGSAKLDSLTVVADLNGGRVKATVETSSNGFQTVQSQAGIHIRDGVNNYPLRALSGASRAVRVRFDLSPARDAPATPVIDTFQITGKPAGGEALTGPLQAGGQLGPDGPTASRHQRRLDP